MLMSDIIIHNARHLFDNTGFIDYEDDTRFTWGEINSRVNRMANALISLGLKKDDKIVIISQNCHQFAEMFFVVAKAGMTGVSLNYRLKDKQLEYMINDCEARAIMFQSRYGETVESMRPNLKTVEHFICIGGGRGNGLEYESMLESHPDIEPKVEVNEDDIHWFLYTSGSTGRPKGVPRTHRNNVAVSVMENLTARHTPDEIFLIGVPLFAFGADHEFWTGCLAGSAIILHVFSGKSFLEIVEKEGVTACWITPTRFRVIKDYLRESGRKFDLSSLKLMPIGGQHTTAKQLKEIMDFFGNPRTFKMLGGTEGTSVMLSWEDIKPALGPDATEEMIKRLDSCGKAPFGCEIRVVDENGQDVAPGEMGELIVKGPDKARQYWNRPDMTARAFTDGWFHPEDMVILDKQGFVHFVARKGYMVKTGGFNVYPAEVETIVIQHPAVRETAVFGMVDEKWGHAVTAAIILKQGMTATEQEIQDYCREYLAGFQVPKSVHFLDEFPRHPGGTGRPHIPDLIGICSGKRFTY